MPGINRGYLMDCSDSEIYAGVKNGDMTAFEQLYREYYTFLRLVAYHITRNYDDADEVVSDVFVKLWNNRCEIEIASSVKAYITRAVQNTAINFARKKESTTNRTNNLTDSEYILLAWDSDYPLGQLYEKDIIEILKKNIKMLPEGCRKVYIMSRDRDFTYIRLAETYIIRAEVNGRLGLFTEAIADLNVVRKRAAYHSGEKRSDVLVNMEPSVITGKLSIPASEKVAPYSVTTDSYSKITIDGTEWQSGSPKAKLENYPPTANSDLEKFIHFVYNEKAREFIFELINWEDLHNAGILYDRVYYRDQMGAPTTSNGTIDFPFPLDDVSSGAVGARGVGKGQFQKYHTFKAWPQSFLELLTDEKASPMSVETKAAYQNPGY